MNRRVNAILAIALLMPTVSFAACDVKSGPKTAALVELYTSEGCSSCPPADKQLSQFPSPEYGLGQVVPLSLHVDYWDYIGWKEPFAQPKFSERQNWLVHANGHKTSFTPHFFVSGTEVRDWRGDLGDELKRVTARPARANISLHVQSTGPVVVSVAASVTASGSGDPLALFVALTEDKLTSSVSAGENRGVTLSHDHVVREWIGPIALNGDQVDFRRAVTTRSSWNAAQLGIAGFVQDLRTGQVLQAVGASQCLRS
jgi:hypothetical protein